MAKKKSKKKADAANKDVVIEWEKYMGHGELADWQRLMRDLGFDEEFTSKTQCRKALGTVWVNIRDFLDAVKNERPVKHFPNEKALAAYTASTRKFYPRHRIPKDSPLKKLLAGIFKHEGGHY
ncbi:hypothetical protein F4777DRAFT_584802 [Nemania sp. FL0916]|nr:hypothetical protein F4777DRAFT_584802 [Nemania sp. FL0916]